jgi:Zn-dependent oligopeptidase
MMHDTTLTFSKSCLPFLLHILTDIEYSVVIIAANLFQTTFAEDPQSRVAWERFRHGILGYGGSRNELEILVDFLGGHPTDPSALLVVLGSSASTT